MSQQHLEFVESDDIVTLTLQRPPVNAFNTALIRELSEFIETIKNSEAYRAVILTGDGEYFSAGADLKERRQMSEAEVREFIDLIRDTFHRWYGINIPTICAMNGGAYGGGLELALMSDFRLLADDAEVGLRETRLGIIPGAGGTQRLARLIGEAKALEWILPGVTHPAEKAMGDGVVNRLATRGEVLAQAEDLAQEIKEAAPIAVRAAKQAIREGLELPFEDALQFETRCYEQTIPTRDRREALRAFEEKRQPQWKGE